MTSTQTLRVIDIIPGTSVDGPGLRTSIYFAGCAHRCDGCHNPQSWDFKAGRDMTIAEIVSVVEENGFNVTFTGGDPMYQAENLTALAKELKFKGYKLWCFTGFEFEEIADKEPYNTLLRHLDVVVDRPFVKTLRDISLRFRGSSNQRLIDVGQSLHTGHIVLWNDHACEL